MFANFGPGHWAVLAIVVIVLFGAKRLPEAARSLGKSLRIFKSEVKELQSDGKPAAPDVTSEGREISAADAAQSPAKPIESTPGNPHQA